MNESSLEEVDIENISEEELSEEDLPVSARLVVNKGYREPVNNKLKTECNICGEEKSVEFNKQGMEISPRV